MSYLCVVNLYPMLHKTRGIVLKTTDYSETSVIVQVYTEKFGLQSYLINGVKKPKAKIKKSMLQPLHLLDMVVYHKPTASMQRVAELRQQPIFQTIPYDILKSSLVMFLNEILYKAIRQQTADEALFEFVYSSIETLDQQQKGIDLFHISFLLRLSRFLGFYPDMTMANVANYFDLKEGCYSLNVPMHSAILQPPHTHLWTTLLKANFSELEWLRISSIDRRFVLEKVITYYQLHVDGLANLKSYDVIKEVFS